MKKFNKDRYLRKLKIKQFFRNNSKYFYIALLCLICGFLGIYFAYSKFFVSEEQEVIKTTVGDFTRGDIVLNIYIEGKKVTKAPQKYNGYKLNKVDCNNSDATWSEDDWKLSVNNVLDKTKCSLYFVETSLYEFKYTGDEQKAVVSKSGIYKLEVWGAGGGTMSKAANHGIGGYGGYSYGYINLNEKDNIYVNVGGSGVSSDLSDYAGTKGGYNGGGSGGSGIGHVGGAGGGGATHMATKSGLLSSLESDKSSILIVAGSGGGGSTWGSPGHGGGYKGTDTPVVKDQNGTTFSYRATGGAQTGDSSLFGLGQSATDRATGHDWGAEGKGGGGAGYYGGQAIQVDGVHTDCAGAGGSGYINNNLLYSKAMYCYNCDESSDAGTKTFSITCNEEEATENCAKKGNGYARITYIPINVEYYVGDLKQDAIPDKSEYFVDKINCEKSSNIKWDSDNWNITINEYEENDLCQVSFKKSNIAKIVNQLDVDGNCPTANEDNSVNITGIEGTNSYLCSTKDDYGTSYYYRGTVTNNYVKFAGFYWRIIRINGDESVRIIYDGTSAHKNGESSSDRQIGTSAFNSSVNDNAYVGYMYGTPSSATYAETHANINDSTMKTYLENWYKTNIVDKNYSQYVVDNIFCSDRTLSIGTGIGQTYTEYSSVSQSKNRIFTCPNKNDTFTSNDTTNGNGLLTYPIGLISVDEAVLAGGYSSANSNYYLYTGQLYWTMSPSIYDSKYFNVACNRYINTNGTVLYANMNDHVDYKNGVKPVINIKNEILKIGDGSSDNPYHFQENE